MRISLADYERDAAPALEPMVHGYFDGGAEDEDTLRWNRAAFGRVRLLPRVLRGVGSRTTETTVLGTRIRTPVVVAPMAFQRLAHPDGEAATARGAGASGTVMVASTLATTPLEEIAEAASGPLWFQLYVYRDREVTRELVERAATAGYRALVLTVDTPVLGIREREVRSGFRVPDTLSLSNLEAAGRSRLPGAERMPGSGPGTEGGAGASPEGIAAAEAASGLALYAHRLLDPNLTWDDVAWLRSIAPLPLVVKGIVHPDDARLAVEAGAAGIVVSNHGGRQLDGAVATLDALPAVAAAAAMAGGAEVYLDGGVRRGVDVLRALALGARAVLVGRPVLWGLTLEGAEGVARVLEILTAELDRALALCGLRSPAEAMREGGELVAPLPGRG
jgi:4-hydroxymandelate oxidase